MITNEENQQLKIKQAQFKLPILARRYNFDKNEFNSLSMLQFAIAAEQTCKDIGPNDPAFMHFAKQKQDFENMAEYLEILEQAGVPVE